MLLTAFNTLRWAYQLHYYLCFRTYRRQKVFDSSSASAALVEAITEICDSHDFHLLKCKTYPDHFRCLLSLQPSQTISAVIQTLTANSTRMLAHRAPLWAHGFLARSVGRVRVPAVSNYLNQQSEHHGYAGRLLPPVFRYKATERRKLYAAHSSFELNHHLVFSTPYRKGLFSSNMGEALCGYWLKVAAARTFAIDQISVVPDHVHLLVRTVPKLCIERCALLLLNNGQHFIGKQYPQLVVQAGIDQVWQASAYAGTSGEVSTAILKHWLEDGR